MSEQPIPAHVDALDGLIPRRDFQERAVRQVAARYARHASRRARDEAPDLPFLQAFAVVTITGKTLLLADTIRLVAAALEAPPLVLWCSRGRVLAQTTYNSLSPGGRWERALGPGVRLAPLGELDLPQVASSPDALVCFATIATFPPGGRDDVSGFSLAGSDLDGLTDARLAALRERRLADGRRRPLILVYDEAHELSQRHAELLVSLAPDLILLASATSTCRPRCRASSRASRRRAGRTRA
ncbi:MAG: hypothetical protein R3C15_18810 [Thermoleophilia bacterium]